MKGEGEPINEFERKYRLWRNANSKVMDLMFRFAKQAVERHRRFGVWLLMNRVRWEVLMHVEKGVEGYRICNNHGAYIARDMIRQMPKIAEYMTIRQVKDRSGFWIDYDPLEPTPQDGLNDDFYQDDT